MDSLQSCVQPSNLPARLKQAYIVMASAQRFAMNDPDWKRPVIVDRVFPFRRLVLAGLSGEKWFISYECGMSQHYYAVVIFRVEHKEVEFLWGGWHRHPQPTWKTCVRKLLSDSSRKTYLGIGLMATPFEGLSRLTNLTKTGGDYTDYDSVVE
jgi:hypothetical protein